MRLERRVLRLESALAPPPPSTCSLCGNPLPASVPLPWGSHVLRVPPPRVIARLGETPEPEPEPSSRSCRACGRVLEVTLVIKPTRPVQVEREEQRR